MQTGAQTCECGPDERSAVWLFTGRQSDPFESKKIALMVRIPVPIYSGRNGIKSGSHPVFWGINRLPTTIFRESAGLEELVCGETVPRCDQRNMKKVLIHWPRYGPYHFARYHASRRVFMQKDILLDGLEIASGDSTYQWRKEDQIDRGGVTTLFQTGIYERLPRRAMAEAIHAFLARSNPDVVAICGYASPDAHACLKWCLKQGKRAVLMTETTRLDKARYLLLEKIKSQYINRFDAAFCGGFLHRDYLLELGMESERIFDRYDVVDNEYFSSSVERIKEAGFSRNDLGLPEKLSPFILASSRLIERKNIMRLLDAYREFRQRHPGGWPLVILGDGPQMAEIRDRIENRQIPDVILPGFRQIDQLPEYYARAELFVHPAESEPWGLVVNEAMASGLPILASKRLGCSSDLVREGINGWKFDPYNTSDMVSVLCRAYESRSLLAHMGSASQHMIGRYTPDHFAENLLNASLAAGTARKGRRQWFTPSLLKGALYPYLRRKKYGTLWRNAEQDAWGVQDHPDYHQVQSAFIIGCGRSGTTILGELLSQHQEVHYLFEPYHLWAALDGRTDVLGLYRDGPSRLILEEGDVLPGLTGRFAALFKKKAFLNGCRLVIEKTPQNAMRIGYINGLDPKSKFIHIARDGVEVARSIHEIASHNSYRIEGMPDLNQWWGMLFRKIDVLMCDGAKEGVHADEVPLLGDYMQLGAYEWIVSMKVIESWRFRLGDRLREIYYADFTHAPVRCLEDLSQFLNITVDESWTRRMSAKVRPARERGGQELTLPPGMCSTFNRYQEQFGFKNRAVPI
ncbi:MAG: glycosyltransferase [Verrucomicrobiae bacterium]|nr:glycosyltransferase [Verrucomicrobiae bacterium]